MDGCACLVCRPSLQACFLPAFPCCSLAHAQDTVARLEACSPANSKSPRAAVDLAARLRRHSVLREMTGRAASRVFAVPQARLKGRDRRVSLCRVNRAAHPRVWRALREVATPQTLTEAPTAVSESHHAPPGSLPKSSPSPLPQQHWPPWLPRRRVLRQRPRRWPQKVKPWQ
jgi:hypothetical protein